MRVSVKRGFTEVRIARFHVWSDWLMSKLPAAVRNASDLGEIETGLLQFAVLRMVKKQLYDL